MKITIATRLRPFTHTPALPLLLPASSLLVKIFPKKIEMRNLFTGVETIVRLALEGPVADFTVIDDLERGRVVVIGTSISGAFRYHIAAVGAEKIGITIEKGELVFDAPSTDVMFYESGFLPAIDIPGERLSLGCHKKQEWDLVARRCQPVEILPILLRVGALAPASSEDIHGGTFSLLDDLTALIDAEDTVAVGAALRDLFRAAFSGILAPQTSDDGCSGLIPEGISLSERFAPFLLSRAATAIRSLFIRQDGNDIRLLPVLPPELHCGRFVDVPCGDCGVISFEWTKKRIRRVVFRSSFDGTVNFSFQSDLQRFRVRTNPKSRGSFVPCGESLVVVAGKTYYFDNFRK